MAKDLDRLVVALERQASILGRLVQANEAAAEPLAVRASRWKTWAGPIAATVTTLTAVASLIIVTHELSATLRQATAAEDIVRADVRNRDFDFLARVDQSIGTKGIVLTNSSRRPLISTAYWLLIRSDSDAVQEIEGLVAGIPPCSSVNIPFAYLSTAGPTTAGSDAAHPVLTEPLGGVAELHLALQAPSGAWLLDGASGSLLTIDLADSGVGSATPQPDSQGRVPSSTEPSVPTYPYDGANSALSALHASELYNLAPDTYWESVDEVATFVAPDLISVGNVVTAGSSVTVERVPCAG